MKIGTITVQNGINYGASLQAFALVHYLRCNGYDAYLIDYRNEDIENRLKERTSITCSINNISDIKNNIRHFFSEILFHTSSYSQKKRRCFESFHTSLFEKNVGPFYKPEELGVLNREYDTFICGSDQIWNRKITGLDDAFFLSFAEPDKLKIAYAPSLGGESTLLTTDDFYEFEKKLQELDFVSVRESNNREFIEKASKKKCFVVVDPVLLLTEQDWERTIADISDVTEKGYAVYYPVINQPELEKMAMKKSKERGIKLINPRLVPRFAKVKGFSAIPNRMVGPLEFVRLIRNAECVFTNSFHATVFSSLFDKELYFLKLKGEHSNRNNRIVEYLKMIEFYPNDGDTEELIHIEKFPKDKLNEQINIKRQESINYLKYSLGSKL